jgi:hypothetical protein
MLDWEDELAICLRRDGVARPHELGETEQRFVIQWQGHYRLEGEVFTYIDNETPTRAQSIVGYPTDGIRTIIQRSKGAA